MKKKLVSMLLLSTIALSTSYIFANTLVTEQVDSQKAEMNRDINGEKRQEEYEKIMKELELDISQDSSEAVFEDISEDKVENAVEEMSSINTQEISVNEIVLTLNSKTAVVNGYQSHIATPPVIKNGRTFLPLRFVVDEVLDADVVWDQTANRVTVTKGSQTVAITIGSQVARVNGVEVPIEAPAFVKNGTTMLPLRFLSETFGITIDYNTAKKQIVLTAKDDKPNTPPSAYFYFGSTNYTEGQTVRIIESSTDADQDKIVAHEWQVTGDMNASGNNIKSIFNTPKVGNYTIRLRVRDGRGLWSQWCEKDITIAPNKAPEITFLEPSKRSYAQGEAIQLTYTYNNESWESIANEKWTYRHVEDPESKAILGKPKVMFTEGEYIVSLQIDDVAGNRSEKYETKICITDEILKSELHYRFTEGNIGEIIDNFEKVNYRDYEDAYLSEISTVSGTMIMSDSPEVVTRDGILYRDSINGKGRILIHHLNGYKPEHFTGDNRRLVLLAQNTSGIPVNLTVSNKSIKGPATDILRVGQLVLSDYLKGSSSQVYTLQPGERIAIYDSKATKWTNGQCISGLMDIMTTGNVTFTTAAVKHGVAIDEMMNMELLTKDIHPRGTFDTTQINYKVVLNSEEPTKLLIGTGTDEWVNGYDAITGEVVQNRGNFGITYRITLTATVDTGIILNPRATNFRGAIKWEGSNTVYNIPETGEFAADTTKSAVLGVIKAGEIKTFEYMLPNGSAAPVLIGFIPRSCWDN